LSARTAACGYVLVRLLYGQERENDAPNYREAQEASASQVPESFDARTRPICY